MSLSEAELKTLALEFVAAMPPEEPDADDWRRAIEQSLRDITNGDLNKIEARARQLLKQRLNSRD